MANLLGVGLALLISGLGLLALLFWPRAARNGKLEIPSLGTRLIRFLTLQGRLEPFFPFVGVSLVVLDLAYNFMLSASPALQTEDTFVLLSASALLGYGLVPLRYTRERDFALLFFLFLDLLLVLPLLLFRAATQSVDTSVDVYSWTALAPELSAVLSALGVSNTIHAIPGATAPALTFTPLHVGTSVTVVITTACSGIYSFGIFGAGYVSFIMTEYTRPSRRLWALLVLGFAASYLANLLRMMIVVLVGYFVDTAQSDMQNLLLAHSYGGVLIFLAWLTLFWGVLFKFLPADRGERSTTSEPRLTKRVASQTGLCSVCHQSLSPAARASRCSCGVYYHDACLISAGACPSCRRSASVPSTPLPKGS